MTIYEQIRDAMQEKNGMIVTSGFIRAELKKKFGVNFASVIPSDFCYNRLNKGIHFKKDDRLFEYLGRNSYKCLGEKYPYTGKIYQKPQGSKTDIVVGSWVNGNLEYPFLKSQTFPIRTIGT